MVMNMMDDIKSHVKDYEDEEEITSYLSKILKKERLIRKDLFMEWDMLCILFQIREKGCSKAL